MIVVLRLLNFHRPARSGLRVALRRPLHYEGNGSSRSIYRFTAKFLFHAVPITLYAIDRDDNISNLNGVVGVVLEQVVRPNSIAIMPLNTSLVLALEYLDITLQI